MAVSTQLLHKIVLFSVILGFYMCSGRELSRLFIFSFLILLTNSIKTATHFHGASHQHKVKLQYLNTRSC